MVLRLDIRIRIRFFCLGIWMIMKIENEKEREEGDIRGALENERESEKCSPRVVYPNFGHMPFGVLEVCTTKIIDASGILRNK